MFVSMEMITILGFTVTNLVAVVSGFAWVLARMDARFAAADGRVDARFDAVESRLSGIEHELTDVKIAVARLEGPTPRLLSVR